MPGRKLDPQLIIETVERLGRRIRERFPNAGLAGVCDDLLMIARQAQQRSESIGRPLLPVRLLSAGVSIVILALFLMAMVQVRMPTGVAQIQMTEFVQVVEAAFNTLLLIGATILFLATLEVRLKRARALKAIHELRSIAHLIDMHQLTKDPEGILWQGRETQSSPKRTMTPFQLNRYLDYCSEMLALSGKIAALYVEHFPDPQAVAAVNDLETLTSGLVRKIWQKIMILHNIAMEQARESEHGPFSVNPSAKTLPDKASSLTETPSSPP